MQSQRILIGRIASAHGLKGEVKLKSFASEPLALGRYGALSASDGRKLNLKAARLAGDFVIAAFDGVADRDLAEGLRGLELYVERNALPDPGEDEFYLADLIGCHVYSAEGAPLGEVVAVPSYGASELLEIRIGASRDTAFVPFTRDFAPTVDTGLRRIVLSREGLSALEGDDGEGEET
jgi:16S rRNA processing protein RimM